MRSENTRGPMGSLTWWSIAACLGCAEVAPDGAPQPDEAPSRAVVAGLALDDARLEAVGMVVSEWPATLTLQAVCTGVLIGDRTVLTSRWCARNQRYRLSKTSERSFFMLGTEMKPSARKLEIVDAEFDPPPLTLFDPPVTRNAPAYGILYLGEPAAGVQVARLAPKADIQVGTSYGWIGYTSALPGDASYRYMGDARVRSLGGRLYEQLYGPFEAYYANNTTRQEPPGDCDSPKPASPRDCGQLEVMRERYASYLLEDGDTVLVAGISADENQCSKEGSPFFQVTEDGLVVYGVNARTFGGRFDSADDGCEYGGEFAAFGPDLMRRLLRAAAWKDPCDGVTMEGRCDGSVARRCSTRSEPRHELVAFDCAALGLECAQDASGVVGCFPAADDP